MATTERPISPHLQIYRFGWTMSLSIFHRATGVVLSIGTIVLTTWLLALLCEPGPYALVMGFMHAPLAIAFLVAWSFAFYYHLCNGIRHLLWDTGFGFELDTARLSAGIVIASSIALTAITWLVAANLGGAA